VNILFIDDTEQSPQYIGIGGVIFHDDCIDNLFGIFNQRKALHGIPPEEEIKWCPRKNSWISKNLVDDNRISAYHDLLSLISAFNGKLIVAVIKKEQILNDVVGAKWQCLTYITERFQFYLQAQEDKKGIIIADFPGSGKEEKQLLRNYHKLLENGTEYVNPKNIVMNLLTTESHLNTGLQIADLIVGITTSMCTPRYSRTLPYWELIKQNFYRNRNEEILGCGLKIFPPEIVPALSSVLFPETFANVEEDKENYYEYMEYIERERYLYSVVMTKDELNMHFPLP
jgi:hypothetical protein